MSLENSTWTAATQSKDILLGSRGLMAPDQSRIWCDFGCLFLHKVLLCTQLPTPELAHFEQWLWPPTPPSPLCSTSQKSFGDRSSSDGPQSLSSDITAVQSHVWHVSKHIPWSVRPVTLCKDTDKELLWKREREVALPGWVHRELTSSMAACVCLCACGGSSVCPIKPPYCLISPLSVPPLCMCLCMQSS